MMAPWPVSNEPGGGGAAFPTGSLTVRSEARVTQRPSDREKSPVMPRIGAAGRTAERADARKPGEGPRSNR